MSEASAPSTARPSVTEREALGAWTRIAAQSFGGPAGQIAVMHRVLVEEKRWLSEDEFLHALNFCMLLPGPEATQLVTYAGWRLHGLRGGMTAGLLFIAPGAISLFILSALYVAYHDVGWIAAIFFGVKAAVLAVVLEAVIRIGKRALKTRLLIGFAAVSFLAICVFQVPFPWIVAVAAVAGLIFGRLLPGQIPGATAEHVPETERPRQTFGRTMATAAIWLVIWFTPVGLLAWLFGTDSVFVREGLFFSQAAIVTFGGAYAVLTYLAQQAVEKYQWMSASEMQDGLGLAETTPGPLIMVVQFVGFVAAFRNPEGLNPWIAALIGSAITTWVTFAPCFLWIFVFAPYLEALRRVRSLGQMLSGITAAVVGAILNLSVWFTLQTLFREVHEWHPAALPAMRIWLPEWATLDVRAAAIAVLSILALFRWHWSMLPTLAAAAGLGLVLNG